MSIHCSSIIHSAIWSLEQNYSPNQQALKMYIAPCVSSIYLTIWLTWSTVTSITDKLRLQNITASYQSTSWNISPERIFATNSTKAEHVRIHFVDTDSKSLAILGMHFCSNMQQPFSLCMPLCIYQSSALSTLQSLYHVPTNQDRRCLSTAGTQGAFQVKQMFRGKAP